MVNIDQLTPEREILREFGNRLARIRKQQGLSQVELAEEAGIGVATLRRIEGGQDGLLESWLKLLKALNMAAAIDALLPETFNSPMAEAPAANPKKRKAPQVNPRIEAAHAFQDICREAVANPDLQGR